MLRPYDFILTKENFLFVVKNYEEFDGSVIASPKYAPYRLAKIRFRGKTWQMLGDKWSRINNPIDPTSRISENLTSYLKDYEQTVDGLRISRQDIKEIFRAKDGITRLIYQESEEKQNRIRKSTKKIVNFLREVVQEDNLGLTGSSLFGGEIEDFSDIDLLVYGSDSYKLMSKFLKGSHLSEIRFRTFKEWEEFYERYGVVAPVSKEQFARHMTHKYDQFLIGETPVSVFAVRNDTDMKLYSLYKNKKDEFGGHIELEGRVSDDSESMFLPSFYKIDNDKCYIYNDNRAFLFQAQTYDRVIISGEFGNDLQGNKWIRITPNNRGFILKVDEK
jgi:predicted nucleotidyltransferase